MPEPRVPDGLEFSVVELKMKLWTDGTNTIATLVATQDSNIFYVEPKEMVIGQGYARRRKGDRRDRVLGESLAMARALSVAAETQWADALKRAGG